VISALNITYFALLVSLVLSTAISASLWENDLANVLQIQSASQVVYFVSILFMIQVTGFGFVIAPVIMQRTNRRYSFVGSLIRIHRHPTGN
jgi:hypothetical protein